MRFRSVISGLSLGALFFVSGCAGDPVSPDVVSPQSSVSPDSTSPGQQVLPFAGAPKVLNPLPASVLSGDPCVALTPTQIRDALGKEVVGESGTTPGLGAKCSWADVKTTAVISVFFVTETHEGLSGVYENSKPQSVVWKELPPIQSFPAVAFLTTSGGDPKTSCTVSVGLRDDLSVDIALSLGRGQIGSVDPCSVAPRLAEAVVSTLRQKAGA